MADGFTEALLRQVQKLTERLQAGPGRSFQETGLDTESSAPSFLTPQQIVDILQGDSAWMDRFERQLESRFASLADRVAAQWIERADGTVKRSIAQWDALLSQALTGEISGADGLPGGAVGDPFAPLEDIFSLDGRIGNRLERLISGSAQSAIKNLFTRTRRSSRESDRSTGEAERFRSSRGQLQAELSRELARGQRYL